MRFTYCPRCGEKLGERKIGDEGLVPWCGRCERPVWEAFTTAVIAAVVSGDDQIVLLRQRRISADTYVCVSGIMKPGESAEDAVVREIGEELGLAVRRLQYMGSWPHKNGDMLMLGFCAAVEKAPLTLSRELDGARWVPFDQALSLIREGSIAWRLARASIALCRKEGLPAGETAGDRFEIEQGGSL